MSRCFPFPPPGYEKKARTDDVDLLKKEKHRERKHKKDKKDKEKREDKDRKDKDKSDGKHRDKKDKKEKSKDKRKDKERDKDKVKTSTSQEKKIPAQNEGCNGDSKPANHSEREHVKVQNITSNEKKQSTPSCGLVEQKPMEKSLYDEGSTDKFVLDLCRRIEHEEKGSASQSTEKILFNGRTNHDRTFNKQTGLVPVEKEKKKEKRVNDIRKMDGQEVRVGAAASSSPLRQNNVGKEKFEIKRVGVRGGFQNRAEEIPRVLETNVETRDKIFMDRRVDDNRKMDGQGIGVSASVSARTLVQNIVAKQKTDNRGVNTSGGFENRVIENSRILEKSIEPSGKNHKKENEDKRESKRSDKDKEKKSHGKDKEREKEKKKEKKAKEKSDRKNKDHDKLKNSVKNGNVVGQNIKLPSLNPDGVKDLVNGQNVKLSQLVPNGDRNLMLGQNTKLPSFLPNGDKSLVIRQNTKLPQPVPGSDGNFIVDQNKKTPPFFTDGDRIPAVEGNTKKRKEIENNGFLHGESLHPLIRDEANVGVNKKLRPTPHPSIENGRKIELFQTSVVHTPDRKVLPPNHLIKVNNTEHKANGKIEVQPLSISLKKTSSSSSSSSSKSKADKIAQAPKIKPPHPDVKYLSEVLSVPKIDNLCDFDDEEWFFRSKDRVSLSVGCTSKASETPSVWAEAMLIESADVCALPYVIPY